MKYCQKPCTMIRYSGQNQPTLPGFDTPPGMILDPNNHWVRLSEDGTRSCNTTFTYPTDSNSLYPKISQPTETLPGSQSI